MTKRAKELAAKILAMHEYFEAGRRCYQQGDALQDEIERELQPGTVVNLGNGQEAELVDPWKEKTKVWRHTGVRRWEIQIRSAKASQLAAKL